MAAIILVMLTTAFQTSNAKVDELALNRIRYTKSLRDKLVGTLSKRVAQVPLSHPVDLDDATLGKHGQLAINNYRGPAQSIQGRPGGFSHSVSASQLRVPRAQFRCSTFNAAHCESAQPEPGIAPTFGRRHAGLATILGGFLGGFSLPFVQPKSALAEEDSPAADSPAADTKGFKEGPEKIKFLDVVPGDKGIEGVIGGDKVKVNYVLKLAESGKTVEDVKNFEFVANSGAVVTGFDLALVGDGGNKMPRMRQGGKRTVLIPSILAYGRTGRGCKISKEAGGKVCLIPPNSALELTVDLISDKPDPNMQKEK